MNRRSFLQTIRATAGIALPGTIFLSHANATPLFTNNPSLPPARR